MELANILTRRRVEGEKEMRNGLWILRILGRPALAVLFLVSLLLGRGAVGAEKVTIALDWIPYGKHAPFFVALEKGYFKDAGLDATIIRGNGSGDTIKIVNAEKVEYGLADMGAMVIARGKGGHVKMISMVEHKNLHVIYALKESGIRTPKDLEGKTIGTVPGEGAHALFPSLALANGVDAKTVKFTTTAFAVKVPSLMNRKVDAVTSYLTDLPNYTKAAKELRKEIVPIVYSNFGIDIYSNGLLTTDRRLQGRPNEVKGVAQSFVRAMAWSVENPGEAVQIFVKHRGTVDPGLARQHWDIMVEHLLTPTTRKTGIGFMTQEKVQRTIDYVAKAWT
ncbi:MAG: ABC transporter substrate-binding protein, partial [Candidatus Tectomicrobia bacterium]|nr:ABC transporter substrate-binding protein [Candidatus Tectomicrobia bacterium]